MSLHLTDADGQNFKPPMFVQAQACSAPYHTERSLPHPFGLANYSWGRVEGALERLLDTFDVANTDCASQESHSALLEAHRQFIYANSEFVESITEKLVSCFVPSGTKLPR